MPPRHPARTIASRPRPLGAALRHARKSLCTRLHALAAQPDGAFACGFALVVAEVEAGFRHEETLTCTLGVERQREQGEENAVVLSALHRVLPLVEGGDAPLGREVLCALLDVLAQHRLGSAQAGATALADAPAGALPRRRANAARATLHVPGRLRHPR
ncbi:hypothetical protein HH212_20815 [Massilia forsythiae]|uniref:Uncharacterized protein n=1 Tax=Massilia forsythiae TaxID=2728020 RepID=A0A7Z2ZU40_9BURK|nr:hypothetical protein [Massilia forsythiae]QJE02158.1 hypothetical protein HH212_20815 [Massilia forsythiae]